MKRGISDLLRNLMSVILAIIVLVALISLVTHLFGFFKLQEGSQANGMLLNVKNSLTSIPAGGADKIFVYTPKNLYFITFSDNKPPLDTIFPGDRCLNQNCICICDDICDKKVYCLQIDKPLKENNQSIKIKIPFEMNVTKNINDYSIINITAGMQSK